MTKRKGLHTLSGVIWKFITLLGEDHLIPKAMTFCQKMFAEYIMKNKLSVLLLLVLQKRLVYEMIKKFVPWQVI